MAIIGGLEFSDAAGLARDITKLRAYECPGASSGADKSRTRDLRKLRRTLVSLSRAGRSEASVARSIRCEPMHSTTSTIFIIERLSTPIRMKNAEWMVARVTLSEPGATGYDFDAVIRLPLKKPGR